MDSSKSARFDVSHPPLAEIDPSDKDHKLVPLQIEPDEASPGGGRLHMPVEGRGLGSRQTQDVARDQEIEPSVPPWAPRRVAVTLMGGWPTACQGRRLGTLELAALP